MDTRDEAVCFGDLLQLLRKQTGMTQEQLASVSAVSVRAIRDLELGRAHRPRRETVRLLGDALRLTASSRALLESAAGRSTDSETLRQLYEEGAAASPAAIGPLVGREHDVTIVCEALNTERLVSLVGLAGVGKTRLALAVASRIHAGGAVPTVWIPGCGGPAGTGPDVGDSSARLGRSRAVLMSWVVDRLSGAGPIDDLAELIGDRRTLLVIDAYESSHVLPDPLLQLLDRCTGLQVLMTTRVPLPLRDVRTVPVAPLPFLWEAGDGTEGEIPPAVSLLLSRLRYSRATLEHTPATVEAAAHICRSLDGIPLALHLAAAWFPVYPPQQLVSMAEEAPLDLVEPIFGGEGEVGGNLRASVQHSISGLRPPEKRLLRALALHGGPLPLDRVVKGFGGPLAETTRAAQVLLLRGLVKQECTVDGRAALVVLNLVKNILMAVPVPRGLMSTVTHA